MDDKERHKLEFGHLIQNVLEDAQARLVFRAQTYIDNDIQKYQPKPEDYEMHAAAGKILLLKGWVYMYDYRRNIFHTFFSSEWG